MTTASTSSIAGPSMANDVVAVGRIIHVIDSRRLPGQCFAAIITMLRPDGFEAEVFWPAALRLASNRDFTGRTDDAGVEWHWPRDEVWHG